ncbi:hypothetical protein LPTSP4_36310 [Leptospira ryugenii]|uniref:Uncharacterized protein n=1 Tax=Leptospira ryugenii TaxID=1917863 RepID=A0A2P2E5E0_9LEPT|nr:hypothetical protein [Leptospira ryugenii]GBF52093.1 hypothetical protein LPTSP4_36310 [Leptospira ryugenii]
MTWKSVQSKFTNGFVKEIDLLSAEFELIKTIDELTTSLALYLESGMEYSFATAQPISEVKFYEIQKDRGNSILFELLQFESSFRQENQPVESKSEKKLKPERKKSDYDFFLEE